MPSSIASTVANIMHASTTTLTSTWIESMGRSRHQRRVSGTRWGGLRFNPRLGGNPGLGNVFLGEGNCGEGKMLPVSRGKYSGSESADGAGIRAGGAGNVADADGCLIMFFSFTK